MFVCLWPWWGAERSHAAQAVAVLLARVATGSSALPLGPQGIQCAQWASGVLCYCFWSGGVPSTIASAALCGRERGSFAGASLGLTFHASCCLLLELMFQLEFLCKELFCRVVGVQVECRNAPSITVCAPHPATVDGWVQQSTQRHCITAVCRCLDSRVSLAL